MVISQNGKTAKGGGKRVFKNSLHEKLLAWKNGTDMSAVGEVAGIPETAWCGGGDMVSFPSSLSPAERRIAHQLCLRLDLFHASSGEGENRYVTISKSGDFESIQLSTSADQMTQNYCIWYDERSVKPVVKSKYFKLSDHEIKVLQRNLATVSGAVNERVSVTVNSPFLLSSELKNLSQMSHMNAKWPDGGRDRTDVECEQDMDKPHTIVDTVEALQQAAAALSACSEVAFDLEMHSYRTYHGLTCLIQLSGGGVNYIVDPLAPSLWDLISTLLGPIFANPNIVKIGHGIMGGDIPALFRDFGIIVVNAFDTQEASGILGRTGVGLAALLDLWGCPLRREVATLKDHMKHADWRLRPLTEIMLRYATLDVHYLVSLYKLQVRELLLSSYSCMAKGNRVGNKSHDGLNQGKGAGADKKNNHYQKDKENSPLSKVTFEESANSLKKDTTETDKDDLEGNADTEDDGDLTGGLEVTVDSLAVHQLLEKIDPSRDCDMEEEDEEGQEVWGLDPAPDAGVNMKSKTNHLSDRFEDEGEGGDEDDMEGDDGGGALAAQFLDDANPIDGEGGDDDDDMWDGWGEEAPTQGKSAAEDLAAELEVCFAAIASPAPTVHRESKGKHNQKDKDKENEKEMAVKSNNKKSSKNDKMGEKGPDTGCKPLSSRAQQQQRRKEMKALKYEREKAKKQETLNLKLEQSIAVGEGVGEEVYEEVCSGEDGEGEGESEEEIDEEDENNRSPVYDDAAAIERRILGETLLKEILERYKTPSTASVPTPNTATFRAVDLSSDPRLSELLGALSSSQQCCQKLWAPKKTSENAYTKVSGFSQRKKTRMGGGQWEAKHVFVFRRLFLWREKEAEKRDESPSYICRGSLLLDAAEFLPTTTSSLMKLQSPLPASMRSDTTAGNGEADGIVDLVGAINDALSVWDVVVRKQVSVPFAERVDGITPDGHRDRHVPKIPINGVRSYEKVETKPSIGVTVRSDTVPSVVHAVLDSTVTSDSSSKQIEGHCDSENKSNKNTKNTASSTSTTATTSTSSVTSTSTSFSTSAFSGPALLLGAVIAVGAMIVIRTRSR